MPWLRLKIQSWLNLEPEEFRPTGFCFAISFVWGFSQMFNWTASSTLFLQFYDSRDLPLVSIASAILIPLSGLLFLRLGRHLRFPSLFLVFAGLFIFSPLLFRGLLSHPGWRWPAMGFAVWYYMEVALAALLVDALVNRLFNLRQAKRVFGPIATGADLAGVPAGFLIALVVKQTGVENLLLIDAMVNVSVVVVFALVARNYRDRMDPVIEATEDDDEAPPISFVAMFRHPLVLCILALGALSEFSLEFINNAFYNRTEAYLTEPEQMASFLGQFFAYASVFSSIIQMLASSRLMSWLGIGGSLVFGPALVALVLVGFMGSTLSGAVPVVVFGCMAAAKFLQFTVMVNIDDVTRFTLIRSLAPHLRDRVLALSGTVMSPLLGGLSGLALLGMIHYLNASAESIALVAAVILAARILVGMKTSDEYRANLKKTLDRRAITGVELPLNDAGTSETLMSLVRDPNPKTALSSLALLSGQAHEALRPILDQALSHPEPSVRRRAAMIFQDVAESGDLPVLSRQLASERDPGTISELLPAAARAAGEAGSGQVAPFLEHEDIRVVGGACIGLIRYGGSAGIQRGGKVLQALAASPRAANRMLAARVLSRIGHTEFDHLDIALLADPDSDVREQAIIAAASLRHPDLAAALLANLSDPELRPVVVRTLIEGSESVLPAIDSLYDLPGQTTEMKLAIVRIYGRVRSETCATLLKQRLGEPRRQIQREIMSALARCHFRARDEDAGIVDSLLLRCGASAAWLMQSINEVRRSEPGGLLESALRRELHKVRDMIFILLGFLYSADSLRFIRFAYFRSRSEEMVSTAVELLENLLSQEHRRFLLPVMEDASPEQTLPALEKIFPQEGEGLLARLSELLERRHGCDSVWIQAVALDFLSRQKNPGGELPAPPEDSLTHNAREWCRPWRMMRQGEWHDGLSVIQKVAALRRAGIFAEVPEETLSDYAPAMVEEYHPARSTILRAGESSSNLYVIVEGRVRIYLGQQTLAEMHAGEIFGELAALDPAPRSANAEALEGTTLLAVDAELIQRMISDRAEAAEGIIRVLCTRIQRTIRSGSYLDTGKWTITETGDTTVSGVWLEDVEKVVLLKTVGIFKSLPDPVLTHLAQLAKGQWLDAGASLFSKGDMGTAMYVIASGEMAVHDGDNIIAVLRRGEIIGELALLTSEVRSSSVSAARPSRLLRITQSALAELMWDHPQITHEMIQVLAGRLRKMVVAAGPAAVAEDD